MHDRYPYHRQPMSRFWATSALSLALHGVGAYGISQLPGPALPEEEPKVLQIQLVARGDEARENAPSPPEAEPDTPAPEPATPPPEPAVAEAEPEPAPETPTPPEPVAKVAPTGTLPSRPTFRPSPPRPAPSTSFADFRRRRMAGYMPSHFPAARGSAGEDGSNNEGRDRCEPIGDRKLDRLYLLYDSSGSMVGSMEDQALRCAQQYARAALDDGATVVVGNFARSTTLFPPTRNATDVAFALRAQNDHTATVLPSTELYRYFDEHPSATADLVILSDGYIPNYRQVMSSYRYFLELNPDNRGYLYTLGAKGHPEVTAALRRIGFDVYVYRLF